MEKNENYYSEDINININIGPMNFTVILGREFFGLLKGFGVENHNHSAYEIHYVLEGSGEIIVNAKKYQVVPNNYYIIAPGVYHEQITESKNPISKYSIRLKYNFQNINTDEDFYPNEEFLEISKAFNKLVFYFNEDKHDTIKLIKEIKDEYSQKRLGYYSILQASFVRMIINIIRDLSPGHDPKYELSKNTHFDNMDYIIEQYFEHSFNKSSNPDDLAKTLNLSTRHLNRIIHKYFNMSFKERIIEKRIETSKHLLVNTDLSIKDISEKVGYLTESVFCSIFKHKTGVTPSEYRNEHLKNQTD